mgnify:CR=1 FL=1
MFIKLTNKPRTAPTPIIINTNYVITMIPCSDGDGSLINFIKFHERQSEIAAVSESIDEIQKIFNNSEQEQVIQKIEK